ncbi:RHS repeat-associated core domain-containing protein [[Clostridium] polysaccharolyticum]|nr:RHS repeat-associated core domain-containing protein [[Clostridium] polysaccharolyticum]
MAKWLGHHRFGYDSAGFVWAGYRGYMKTPCIFLIVGRYEVFFFNLITDMSKIFSDDLIGSRYYNPETERFINADEYSLCIDNNQNMYKYCENNPMYYIDSK